MRTPSGGVWIVALCASLWACGAGGGGRPGEVELARQTIGPEGGTVTVSGGDLSGLRIDVPAQAVSAPTTFTVSEVTAAPDLSPLPPGFAAFNPTIRITATPAVAGRVRVTFPLNGLPTEADKVLGAFFYDEASAAWTLALPRAVSAQEVTVETGHFSYWRWGFTLLDQAQDDALARAIAEWLGQTLYEAFEAELHQQYDAIIASQLPEPADWTNCEKILALGDAIGAVNDGAVADLHDMLIRTCGGCDVSATVFMTDLEKYVGLKMKALLLNGFAGAMNVLTGVNSFVGLVMRMVAAAAFDSLRHDLRCDYDCLFDSPPPGMIGDMAVYYLSAVGLVILDIAFRYDGCEASSSGAPSSAAYTPAR